MSVRKFRIAELYAGTARSVEPFRKWRRAEIALLVDANEFAKETYLHNFPKAPYQRRNLTNARGKDLNSWASGKIDILLGCPPCQGFSETGARDLADPRNKHIRRFTSFAVAAEPLVIVMENVPLVATSSEFLSLIQRLESAGYRWSSVIANSAQYGSAQCRQRLLFVAFHRTLKREPEFPRPTHGGEEPIFSYSKLSYQQIADDPEEMLGITPAAQRVAWLMSQDWLFEVGKKQVPTVRDIIGDLPRVGSRKAAALHHARWDHSPKLLRRMDCISEGRRWSGGDDHYSHTYARLHRRGLARTLTTFFPYAGNGRYWHPTQNRSLTLREAARLQGFPDDFLFTEQSKRSAALVGNALDSSLASICYEMVRDVLE